MNVLSLKNHGKVWKKLKIHCHSWDQTHGLGPTCDSRALSQSYVPSPRPFENKHSLLRLRYRVLLPHQS